MIVISRKLPVIKKIVICMILKNKKLMLQLRDSNENIVYPNKWGFFGGAVKIGESPLYSVKREMKEELNLKNFKSLRFINNYFDSKTNSLFYVYILRLKEKFELKEGADYNFFFEYEYLRKKKSKKLKKIFECADTRLMKIFGNMSKKFF
jgi:ADP-ribose pyrophosphatase YjhB (NUDIX family)